MAVAAKKLDNELRYAPATRVYAQGSAAPALEPQERQRPQVKPGRQVSPVQATRIARSVCPRPRVSPGRLMFVTLAIMAGSALMIITLVRYAMITQEYTVVNETREQIEESGREIAALKVQLNAAVSLEEARAAALEAGMGYPTAEQIIRIQGGQQAQSGGQTAPE